MFGVVPGVHQVMHHQSMSQSDRNQDKLVGGNSILDRRLSLKALNGARQFLVYFAEQSAKLAFELPVPSCVGVSLSRQPAPGDNLQLNREPQLVRRMTGPAHSGGR